MKLVVIGTGAYAIEHVAVLQAHGVEVEIIQRADEKQQAFDKLPIRIKAAPVLAACKIQDIGFYESGRDKRVQRRKSERGNKLTFSKQLAACTTYRR